MTQTLRKAGMVVVFGGFLAVLLYLNLRTTSARPSREGKKGGTRIAKGPTKLPPQYQDPSPGGTPGPKEVPQPKITPEPKEIPPKTTPEPREVTPIKIKPREDPPKTKIPPEEDPVPIVRPTPKPEIKETAWIGPPAPAAKPTNPREVVAEAIKLYFGNEVQITKVTLIKGVLTLEGTITKQRQIQDAREVAIAALEEAGYGPIAEDKVVNGLRKPEKK